MVTAASGLSCEAKGGKATAEKPKPKGQEVVTARTYPQVASVVTMIPVVAQERLRAMIAVGLSVERQAKWVALGMGIMPAKAVIDLEKMRVTHTL